MPNVRDTKLFTSFAIVVGTKLFASVYDDILYPVAIATFGPLWGGVGFSIIAVVLNILLVYWYRRSEGDWFGFEAERLLGLNGEGRKESRVRLMKFVGLAMDDPSIAFMYYRGRGHQMKMSWSDWLVFTVANAIGISVWLGFLFAIYFSGGYFSERMADGIMYLVSAWGMFFVLWSIYKQRVASR